jgi:hypothetical protein
LRRTRVAGWTRGSWATWTGGSCVTCWTCGSRGRHTRWSLYIRRVANGAGWALIAHAVRSSWTLRTCIVASGRSRGTRVAGWAGVSGWAGVAGWALIYASFTDRSDWTRRTGLPISWRARLAVKIVDWACVPSGTVGTVGSSGTCGSASVSWPGLTRWPDWTNGGCAGWSSRTGLSSRTR